MNKVRLNKFLAEAGIASRREADKLISAGLVKVNNQVIAEIGIKVDPSKDNVEFKNQTLQPAKPLIFMFNKPVGVTSTTKDAHANKTIADYFKNMGRVYPVGRLDKDSEGLILVTNNGELTNQLTHPKFEHEKEYDVLIEGESDDNIPSFSAKFILDGYKTRPMQIKAVKPIGQSQWLITLILKEGRKRQVRKISEKLGYKVINLKRTRIGKLKLGSLPPGEFKEMQQKDIL